MNASTAIFHIVAHIVVRIVALACVTLPLTGCYVLHVARGQSQVMAGRQPIPTVIANPSTSPALKTRLEQVLDIRRFAVRELGLPDNGSYRSYADVRRPYVVWNVFAAKEFSVEPRRWCYPFAGCVAYRGYFSEKKARAFAEKLRRRRLDVFVGGVTAYSTLGHFDDPVLSTMIGWGEVQLASIVFHELAHQILYIPSDSRFNEAFATVVEDEGIKRWLQLAGREKELERYREQRRRYVQAAGLFIAARQRLRGVYTDKTPPQVMREEKGKVLNELKAQYAAFRASGRDSFSFDPWFTEGVNNAHLASVATYEECVPGLKTLLADAQGDLARFYAAARDLAKLRIEERHRRVCQRPS